MKLENSGINEMQSKVNQIVNGKVTAINDGIVSDVPILQMNAILYGVKYRVRETVFLQTIEKLCGSETTIMDVPIKQMAIAACDVMGVNKYNGTDKTIRDTITCMKTNSMV